MSEALRRVFLELGFDIDLPTLEKAEKKLQEAIKTTEGAAKATDKAEKLKSGARAKGAAQAQQTSAQEIEASEKAAKEQEKAAKAGDDKLSKMLKVVGIDAGAAREAISAFGVTASLKLLALGGVMVGLVHRAFAFADSFAAVGEELRDTSRESRVTTDDLQGLRYAAVQGGVGVDRMNSGLDTFGKSLRAAERWGNGTTSTLRRLGIQARDANGHIRPTSELMDEVAIAMEHVQSPTRRAAIATQLFGESGRRMLDVLHTGPGGIRALREEMAALGGGVSQEAVAASREYTQATEKLSRAQDSLRSVLAVTLLPVLSWVTTALAKLGGFLANVTKGTHVVQIALGALGVVGAAVAVSLLVAWGPVIAPFVAAAAAVAALVLIFDDLTTFVEGGDSAIGRFIDSIFGVGTSVEYVHELRAEWEAVQNAIADAIGWVARFLDITPDLGIGTLSTPRPAAARGASRARPGASRAQAAAAPATSPGRAATAPAGAATVAVPGVRTVAAPGTMTRGARTIVQQRSSAPVMHFHGVTDANQISQRVAEVIRREDANRRDADHPVEDDEG